MSLFKNLFKSKNKKDLTRQDLIVTIDDRVTGDQSVLSIKTTSGTNVILEFAGQVNKMAVNPQDLQDALTRVQAFIDARLNQPMSLKALGVNTISSLGDKINNEEKKLEKDNKLIQESLNNLEELELGN